MSSISKYHFLLKIDDMLEKHIGLPGKIDVFAGNFGKYEAPGRNEQSFSQIPQLDASVTLEK